MAVTGNGTNVGVNPFAPGGPFLMEAAEITQQDSDGQDPDAEESDDDAVSIGSQSLVESQEEEEAEVHAHPSGPDDDQSDVDMGVEAYDWLHVFQYRLSREMRHCFIRWSFYRNLVSGVANTWDISQDDVMEIVEIREHPTGIPRSSKAVIVIIWGDSFAYDTRLSVLVDIELHQPLHFLEGPILDRRVYKFPFHITRQGVLQISQTEGICHSRNDRCLVHHNGESMPSQRIQVKEVKPGDYFVIKIPPLEDILASFPTPSSGTSLLQRKVATRRSHATLSWDLLSSSQALGNVEDATWDLTKESNPQLIVKEKEVFIDPMEGLQDPGNPEFFNISDDDDREDPYKREVDLSLQVQWDWTELLKLFCHWGNDCQYGIPSEAGVNPVALQYLSGCNIGIEECDEIWIYTDGSYNPRQESAAFAVGVFGFTRGFECSHHFGGWFGHKVILEADHPLFTGAAALNAAEAEISGLIWAHVWAIQSGHNKKVVFCYDSLLAGNGASGDWGVNPNWQRLSRLRHIAQVYEQIRKHNPPMYEHTKAHSNHPANDLLDALAKYCAEANENHFGGPMLSIDWRPLFGKNSSVLEWGWWIIASISGFDELPSFRGQESRWTFKVESQDGVGITPIEEKRPQQDEEISFHLKIASFNVLSLMKQHEDGEPVGPVRASFLRSQLEFAGFHIVGLHETRTSKQAVFQAEDYVRIVSGDEKSKGKFGCELWLARRLPIGTRGSAPIYIRPDRITVLHGDPRLLIVKVQIDSTALTLAVGHAPHEQTPEGEKNAWWNRSHAKIKQFSKHGRVLFMGDFNARVSEQDGVCVGDKTDAILTDNGSRLLQLCQDLRLWLPSTFSNVHPGSDYTWYNPRGSKSRLDYIALEQQFKGCVRTSWVDQSIQVPNNALDHLLVGLELAWQEQSSFKTAKKYGDYDWDEMATPEGRKQLISIVEGLPQVSWDTNVHRHWQILEESLHQGLQDHFPAHKRNRRSDIFTNATWEALEKRRRLRQNLDELDNHIDSLDIKTAFWAWKDGVAIQ